MTVSSTTNRWAYTGNGATTAFTYTNRIFEAADLKVFLGGTLQGLGSHYTLSGVGNPAGGNVTFLAAPASGAAIVLVRDVPATQGLDLAALGSFPAEENEKALDRLTVLVQQLIDGAQRSLRQPPGDFASIGSLPGSETRKGKILGFNITSGDPEAAVVSGQVLVAGEGIALDGNVVALDPTGLATVAPAGGDRILIGDMSDGGTIKAALAADVLALAAISPTISPQTVDFTAGNSASNVLYMVTPAGASADCTLPATSAVPDGFFIRVKNQADGKSVRLLRTGTDTIDGQAAFRVPGREEVEVTRTGAGAWSVSQRPSHAVGDILEWGSNSLREGGFAWLNGQALSRSDYKGLFDEWGTTYGTGNGSTTFNVRDDRGRVKAGKDNMGGASAANRLTGGAGGVGGTTLGAAGGTEGVTLTGAQSGTTAHAHDANVSNFPADGNYTATAYPTGTTDGPVNLARTTTNVVNTVIVRAAATADAASAHPNVQPTIVSNFIVKT